MNNASKRWTREQIEFALVERELGRLPMIKVPLGAIVAVCNLVDVRPSYELKTTVSAIERIYGDYSPGRFGWLLDNIRPLAEPIAFCGRQGFFNVPDELLRA